MKFKRTPPIALLLAVLLALLLGSPSANAAPRPQDAPLSDAPVSGAAEQPPASIYLPLIQTEQFPVPEAIQYQSIDGLNLTLYPYSGEHVALLVPSDSLNAGVLMRIVAAFDKAYAYYAAATGREPILYRQLNGKGTIAVVPSTCGAGCAFLGATGIEITHTSFDILYEGVSTRDEYDQVVFYELGRNFWFYGDALAYHRPDNTEAITTGYAVFMRFMAMDAAGIKPGPFNQWDFSYFRAEVEGLLDRYLADPTLNWDNTLRAGEAPSNPIGLGATDLFASFLFELRARYGDTFVAALWHEAANLPAAGTTQEAVDNFIAAASAAAGEDLTSLFRDQWRWPVSGALEVR